MSEEHIYFHGTSHLSPIVPVNIEEISTFYIIRGRKKRWSGHKPSGEKEELKEKSVCIDVNRRFKKGITAHGIAISHE